MKKLFNSRPTPRAKKIEKLQSLFNQHYESKGLKKSYLNCEFQIEDQKLKIIGLDPNLENCICQNVENEKCFMINNGSIIEAIEKVPTIKVESPKIKKKSIKKSDEPSDEDLLKIEENTGGEFFLDDFSDYIQ